MSALSRAGHAVWEFVVGDDWRIALGVVLALGVVAVLVALGVNAWWVTPPAVLALLTGSVLRAAMASGGD